jgi:hypothetical protein
LPDGLDVAYRDEDGAARSRGHRPRRSGSAHPHTGRFRTTCDRGAGCIRRRHRPAPWAAGLRFANDEWRDCCACTCPGKSVHAAPREAAELDNGALDSQRPSAVRFLDSVGRPCPA